MTKTSAGDAKGGDETGTMFGGGKVSCGRPSGRRRPDRGPGPGAGEAEEAQQSEHQRQMQSPSRERPTLWADRPIDDSEMDYNAPLVWSEDEGDAEVSHSQ